MDPNVDGHEKAAGVPHAMPRTNSVHQVAGHGSPESNTTVPEATGLPPVSDIINKRRSALFGHTVRLGKRTPAHRALKLPVDARCGCPSFPSWRGLAVRCVTHGSDS